MFDLQGHRGARGLAPENTLPSFAAALTMGVSTLELDVGVTADGEVVVAHDRRLNPDITRDGAGHWIATPTPTVRSLTLAQIQAYDVGRIRPGIDYARRYPEQKGQDGVRMPRLADVFALVKKAGNGAVRFNIETKLSPAHPDETVDPEAFARAVVAVIQAAGMESRSTIQSFDWRTLLVVQKIAPRARTSCLTVKRNWLDTLGNGSDSAWTAGFRRRDHGSLPRMIRAAGCSTWSPYHEDIDAAAVKEAQGLGLTVIPWTINDAPTMEQVIDLGVDGLITDRPDIGRQVLAGRGLALPSPTPVT